MKKTLRTVLAGLLVVPVLAFGMTVATGGTDVSAQISGGLDAADTHEGPRDLTGDSGVITTVINVLLFIIGALAVIMLIWGGIRYTTSGGNQQAVTSAKNTIVYAVIGLVVAIFAWALVNYIVNDALAG